MGFHLKRWKPTTWFLTEDHASEIFRGMSLCEIGAIGSIPVRRYLVVLAEMGPGPSRITKSRLAFPASQDLLPGSPGMLGRLVIPEGQYGWEFPVTWCTPCPAIPTRITTPRNPWVLCHSVVMRSGWIPFLYHHRMTKKMSGGRIPPLTQLNVALRAISRSTGTITRHICRVISKLMHKHQPTLTFPVDHAARCTTNHPSEKYRNKNMIKICAL